MFISLATAKADRNKDVINAIIDIFFINLLFLLVENDNYSHYQLLENNSQLTKGQNEKDNIISNNIFFNFWKFIS